MLPSHLRLDLQSSLFFSGIPTEILYAILISPMRATCLSQLTLWFGYPNIKYFVLLYNCPYECHMWIKFSPVNFLLIMEQNSSWEATIHSVIQKISHLLTRMLITVFIRAWLWSLSSARWIQSTTSHPDFLISYLIWSCRLRLDLLSGIFP